MFSRYSGTAKKMLAVTAVAFTVLGTLPAQAFDAPQVAAKIRVARPKLHDPMGWATDILGALQAHKLPQTPDNVCSLIAIIDQESAFSANPAVPNLGKISEKALIKKLNQHPLLGGQASNFLTQYPNPSHPFMQRIRQAKTERDLDWAYRDVMAGLAQVYKLSFLMNSSFTRDFIESQNEINTLGAMQVDVGFAIQHEMQRRGNALSLQDIYQLRDTLYTRKGGLYYGTLLLLGYETAYDKKLYRFADYNAGRYSSRNAAFQQALGALAKQPIIPDGDLLIYEPGGAISPSISNTEQMVRYVADKYGLILPDQRIRSDLMQEKTLGFNLTSTYKTVIRAYQLVKKSTPAYAIVPQITLHSEKTLRILTTERFANKVNQRYQRCIAQPLAVSPPATSLVAEPAKVAPPAASFLQNWINAPAR
jgi:hypothetical protein